MAEAMYVAFNSGDLDGFLALLAEDVEFTSLVAEAEGRTFRGHADARAWWDTVRGMFREPRWALLDVQGSGERAVAKFHLTGTLAGVPVAQTMWQAAKLRDGKLSWWAFFRTESEALEAVGLREQAMVQENVELFHHAYDAVNRRDLDALLGLMDADVEAVPILSGMEGGYHGHAGIRRWWENLLDVFPDFASELVEVRDLGDLTLATLRIHGHGAGSDAPLDAPLDAPIWLAARWRSGKCVRWGAYRTEDEAVAAVSA